MNSMKKVGDKGREWEQEISEYRNHKNLNDQDAFVARNIPGKLQNNFLKNFKRLSLNSLIPLLIGKEPICHISSNNWMPMLFGAAIGSLLSFLSIYSLKYLRKRRNSSKRTALYTYPKTRSDRKNGIDLINRKDLISEEV